ncbi:MAG TPA: ASCH domain-containing protein [Terriglobales bacterium]|nr:ASCH domain-containing protein [Terriglobales bacterium]
MKALSLWQPWASLIAIGAKEYETRSWSTKYRGPLVIHASKTTQIDWTDRKFMNRLSNVGLDIKNMPIGAGLCLCNLVAVYRTEDCSPYLSEQELAFGDFSPGRAAWKLEIVRVFKKPVPGRGAQGLFNWDGG